MFILVIYILFLVMRLYGNLGDGSVFVFFQPETAVSVSVFQNKKTFFLG